MCEALFLGTTVLCAWGNRKKEETAKINPRFLSLAVSWRGVLFIEMRRVTDLWGKS